MKNDAGNPKINNEGKRINNGCDKRAGHDGRIKAETFGQNRQKAADDFGEEMCIRDSSYTVLQNQINNKSIP